MSFRSAEGVTDCFTATGYWHGDDTGGGVEWDVIYAEAPDEVLDIGNILLVGFLGK